jgi:hypothetical protein
MRHARIAPRTLKMARCFESDSAGFGRHPILRSRESESSEGAVETDTRNQLTGIGGDGRRTGMYALSSTVPVAPETLCQTVWT